DRIAIPVPLYHLYGLGAAFLPSVAVGATIDLQKSANLLRYLEREKDFNPNVAFMTPSFCETLIKGRKSARDYKLTVIAGDRIKEDTFTKYERNFGRLLTLYGSTEMGVIAAASPKDQSDVRCQTVGLPMSGEKIRIKTQSIDSQ
ncbi:MAG: AMP-binding protein, partial [Dolichospermum sp.]